MDYDSIITLELSKFRPCDSL